MNSRYLYLKFIGFLLAVIGFSYSLTSFYNLYDYLYGFRVISNANVIVMIIGLLLPLYMFIYGVYFYLYTDTDITKMNRIIVISSIDIIVSGIAVIVFKMDYFAKNMFSVAQLVQFLHVSLGYLSIVLGGLSLHACIVYKL